jgi:hypothetical protein
LQLVAPLDPDFEAIDIEDKREPYSVKVTMELREAGGIAGRGGAGGAGDEAEVVVFAAGEAVYQKVGAVRSMW